MGGNIKSPGTIFNVGFSLWQKRVRKTVLVVLYDIVMVILMSHHANSTLEINAINLRIVDLLTFQIEVCGFCPAMGSTGYPRPKNGAVRHKIHPVSIPKSNNVCLRYLQELLVLMQMQKVQKEYPQLFRNLQDRALELAEKLTASQIYQ